jgi:hypothetical protein
MLKLIKEYFKTGAEAHISTIVAQEAMTLTFNSNNLYLKNLLKIQNTEAFREKERVFDKIRTLNTKKKKTELEEKELLNLINYIDNLI